VDKEVKARAAGNADLDGPWRAVGLEAELAVGGGGRLQVGGKAAAVLVCSYHGDGARDDGSDGDGAQFALGGIAVGLVAILRQGDQAPPQEP